jgi:hypothetical protein
MANTTAYTTTGNKQYTQPDATAFDEMEGEQLVKFAQFGDQLAGVVLFVRGVMVKEQKAVECGLRTKTGNVKFLMNHDLQSKITTADVGRVAVVVLDSEMDTGAESKMRVYKVWLSKKGGQASIPAVANTPAAVEKKQADARGSDPGITDDDIPF